MKDSRPAHGGGSSSGEPLSENLVVERLRSLVKVQRHGVRYLSVQDIVADAEIIDAGIAEIERLRMHEIANRARFEEVERLRAAQSWRPIETANASELFAKSMWVLIHTSDGRVTEGLPHFTDDNGYFWVASRGNNCAGTGGTRKYLRDTVTHWMPLPDGPSPDSASESR